MEINNEKVYEIIQKDLDILTFFKITEIGKNKLYFYSCFSDFINLNVVGIARKHSVKSPISTTIS